MLLEVVSENQQEDKAKELATKIREVTGLGGGGGSLHPPPTPASGNGVAPWRGGLRISGGHRENRRGAIRRRKGGPTSDNGVRGGLHLGGVFEGGCVPGAGGARAHTGVGPAGGVPGGEGVPPVLPVLGTRAPGAVVPLRG